MAGFAGFGTKLLTAGKSIASTESKSGDKSDDDSDSGHTPLAMNKQSFKKGGKVKHTGMAKVHKGEQVLKASTARKYRAKHGGRKRSSK